MESHGLKRIAPEFPAGYPFHSVAKFLVLVGGGENLAAVVLAAARAHAMRALHLAAVGAGHEMIQTERVVRATLVAARFGDFPLGNCTHDVSSSTFEYKRRWRGQAVAIDFRCLFSLPATDDKKQAATKPRREIIVVDGLRVKLS
jgi:hypothetical protein